MYRTDAPLHGKHIWLLVHGQMISAKSIKTGNFICSWTFIFRKIYVIQIYTYIIQQLILKLTINLKKGKGLYERRGRKREERNILIKIQSQKLQVKIKQNKMHSISNIYSLSVSSVSSTYEKISKHLGIL